MPRFFVVMDKIKPVYDAVDKALMFLCKVMLIADIILACFAVSGRYLPFLTPPIWGEEAILTIMSYMAVISAALAIRRGAHIRMTVFDRYIPQVAISIMDIIADLAVCALAYVMIVYGWQYTTTLGSVGTYVSMPWLSRFWMYFPIPLAGVAMLVFEVESIYQHVRKLFVKEEGGVA